MAQLTAVYYVTDSEDGLEQKAEKMATGMTAKPWIEMPEREKQESMAYKGEVVSITRDEEYGQGSLVTISFPVAYEVPDFPAILTTTYGRLSYEPGVKLMDLKFSDDLVKRFPGPAFGIKGIRELLEVGDRPLTMSVAKGAIGRSIDSFHEQMLAHAYGGIDIIQDDERLFEHDWTPFEQRVPAGLAAIAEAAEQTERAPLYVVNLSGKTFELKERAREAVALGAPALMLNVYAYGLDVLQGLREDEEIDVPIFAHSSLTGMVTRSRNHGISSRLLLGRLMRMAGADAVLFPSPYGRIGINMEEALQVAKFLREESPAHLPAFPIPSAGIDLASAPSVVDDFGSDVVVNAGGSVHRYKGGVKEGGRALARALEKFSS
ncbi:2,3-diketo-5-methylthiopentyl-1-phosphate enolase [Shouchella shacheensis]|uniref:2,3-diketo-5-methylthiopentyl-1-phosphate enolase n=1 Tax=Shouchella shacheensis TaxID=1649580 RepID=UPI0007402C31|nr:2,3-diketo-5-methylthiopentyl-1-phosphate enolase [Shouchella shacheensis]